jgi:hypothetical protein
MKERLIALRPILHDGRLYRTGEEVPMIPGKSEAWLNAGDARKEGEKPIPLTKRSKKGGEEKPAEGSGDDVQGDGKE